MTDDTIDTAEERRNVEAFRAAIAAYIRHDPEPFFALMDDAVRFGIAAAPEQLRFGGMGQGVAWVRRVIGEIAEDFEWLSYENRELIAERDWVIALSGGKIRDRASGVVLDADLVDVMRFRDGRIVHFIEYFDTALLAARAAARAKATPRRRPKAAKKSAVRSKARTPARRKATTAKPPAKSRRRR